MGKKAKIISGNELPGNESSEEKQLELELGVSVVSEEKPKKVKAVKPVITFEEVDAIANEVIASADPIAFIPAVSQLSVEKINEQVLSARNEYVIASQVNLVPEEEAEVLYKELVQSGSFDASGEYVPYVKPADFAKIERALEELNVLVLESTPLSVEDLKNNSENVLKSVQTILDAQTDRFNAQMTSLQSSLCRELGKIPQLISMVKSDVAGLRRQLEALSLGESTEIAKVEEIKESVIDDQFKAALRKYIMNGLVDDNKNQLTIEATILAETIMSKTKAKRVERAKETGLPEVPIAFSLVDLVDYFEEIKAVDDFGMVSKQYYVRNGGVY